jgi:hypothetical protein
MTSPGAAPEPTDPAPGTPAPGTPAPGARVAPSPAGEPMLPGQSPEDTDAAWGEYRQPDDDRLSRDRPPHWDDF